MCVCVCVLQVIRRYSDFDVLNSSLMVSSTSITLGVWCCVQVLLVWSHFPCWEVVSWLWCVHVRLEWSPRRSCFPFYRSESLNGVLTAVSSIWLTWKANDTVTIQHTTQMFNFICHVSALYAVNSTTSVPLFSDFTSCCSDFSGHSGELSLLERHCSDKSDGT